MEKPSQELLKDIEISKQLISAIDKNHKEVEEVLILKVISKLNSDNLDDLLCELYQEKEDSLSKALDTHLPDKFLYKMSHQATLEAKAYCLELSNFGNKILDGSLSFEPKVILFHYLRIFGCLFDRSDDNYYICQHILLQFLKKLKSFYNSKSPEEQKFIVKTVFMNKENAIVEKREYLEQACKRIKVDQNSEINFIRDANIEDWVVYY